MGRATCRKRRDDHIPSTTALTWIEIESRDDERIAMRGRGESELLQLVSRAREDRLLAGPRVDVRAQHLSVCAEREREGAGRLHGTEIAARLLFARVKTGSC